MSGPCVTLITLTFWTATAHFIQCLVGTSLGRASILLSHARCELSQRRALTPSRATPCEQRTPPRLPCAACLLCLRSARPRLWSWSPSLWCGTPLLTATFPHGLVQSRRRIRSRGRRWRVASYQRKVVKMDPFQPPPEGPPQAGGDPAPGNVAITRLPEAGVREHPAPLGALRHLHLMRGEVNDPHVREHPAPLGALRLDEALGACDSTRGVREHPAPLGALRHHLRRAGPRGELSQGAPRTARCIKTDHNDLPHLQPESGSTPHCGAP